MSINQRLDLLRLHTEEIERFQTQARFKEPLVSPDFITLKAKAWPQFSRQRRLVLAIGINAYQDLPSLQFARKDAEYLVTMLRTTALSSIETSILTDHNATRSGILAAMYKLAEYASEEDQVWLFFAGIGLSEQRIGYLVPADGNLSNLPASTISMSDIGSWLRRLRAKQVVVIADTCSSGALALALHRGISIINKDARPLAFGNGRVFITAGTEEQLSFEDPELQHGFFSYYLTHRSLKF